MRRWTRLVDVGSWLEEAAASASLTMAPSAIEETINRRDIWKTLPAPKLHPVKEARFEKYVEPQDDGHKRALTLPHGEAAIIIDNGTLFAHFSTSILCALDQYD